MTLAILRHPLSVMHGLPGSILVIALIVSQLWADPLPPASQENFRTVITSLPDQQPRATTIQRTTFLPDQQHYVLQEYGMGSLGKFNQLRWDLESKFKINSGHYSVLRTSREGRSAEKRILFSENIYYDYANKRITFTRVKGADGIPEQTIFPLTNPTTDYATLFHFMQNEINWEKRTNCSFYLVTSKPSLEKINVKFLSREKISTGQEAINALKVQLIFDQGILDNLFAGFIPSTFIWVEDQLPYRWIKYEGPELGDSATIIRIERQKLIP